MNDGNSTTTGRVGPMPGGDAAGWTLVWDQYDPEQEGKREALCTLGNGYLATRGATPESRADGVHYPGTYISGLYNRLAAEAGGEPVEVESIVQIPNWLPLRWRVDGDDWFDIDTTTILAFGQEVDLRQAVLTRSVRIQDAAGRRTRLVERRFAQLGDGHLAALQLSITAENWEGRIDVEARIDGAVRHTLVADDRELATRHIEVLDAGADDEGDAIAWLRARTLGSRIEIAVATRLRVAVDGERRHPDVGTATGNDQVWQTVSLDVTPGQEVTVEKVAAIFTGRDRAIDEPLLAARRAATGANGFSSLLEHHAAAWERLWRRCRLELDADGDAPLIVRLNQFHLLGTLSPLVQDRDVGVPSRGWAEAYRGHVFWDELLVLPWFTLHLPEVSRAALHYRYRRLDEARAMAWEAGYQGAMFPWRSASDGREATPPFYFNPRDGGWIRDHTFLQRHIGAAIAVTIREYVAISGDHAFLHEEGAEMLLEIARFWSSIATWSDEHQRYEIRGVMGPDEFHTGTPGAGEPGLVNNTYTNVMAASVLCHARETLDRLPAGRQAELRETLALDDDELARWDDVSRRLRLDFLDNGIPAQFEGFGQLEEPDQDAWRERYGDISRIDYILHAEGDTPNRYTLAKQPDVMMLFHVLPRSELAAVFARLGYPFDDELVRRTIAWYSDRSTRGSTLSGIVDAGIAVRGDRRRAWASLDEALHADFEEDSTAEGVHLGAMAGTLTLIERCFTGLDADGDVARFDPGLPDGVRSFSLVLLFRGCWLEVTVTPNRLRVVLQRDAPSPLTVAMGDRRQALIPGDTVDWPY